MDIHNNIGLDGEMTVAYNNLAICYLVDNKGEIRILRIFDEDNNSYIPIDELEEIILYAVCKDDLEGIEI